MPEPNQVVLLSEPYQTANVRRRSLVGCDGHVVLGMVIYVILGDANN